MAQNLSVPKELIAFLSAQMNDEVKATVPETGIVCPDLKAKWL